MVAQSMRMDMILLILATLLPDRIVIEDSESLPICTNFAAGRRWRPAFHWTVTFDSFMLISTDYGSFCSKKLQAEMTVLTLKDEWSDYSIR